MVRVAIVALAVILGLAIHCFTSSSRAGATTTTTIPTVTPTTAVVPNTTTTLAVTTTTTTVPAPSPTTTTVVKRKPTGPMPIPVPLVWRTDTATTSYPDATDPTRFLPRIDQLAFACIRRYESRNHLNDGGGSQGWYQFTYSTWNSAAAVLHLPQWTNTWSPNMASGDMQSEVAVWYFDRNGRFGVQWSADANKGCPGVFFF